MPDYMRFGQPLRMAHQWPDSRGCPQLRVRGGFGGFSNGGGGPDFSKMRDDEGNIIASSESEEEEEENYDGTVVRCTYSRPLAGKR